MKVFLFLAAAAGTQAIDVEREVGRLEARIAVVRDHVGNLLVVHLADLAAARADQMVVVASTGFDRLVLRPAVERVAADDAGLEENLHGVVDRGLRDVERAFGLEA